MIPYTWLKQAANRISAHLVKTPLTYDPDYDIYLKWENHQVTGSFKARGALNKALTLQSWERERGLVTASAGNHGQGVALAGKLMGAPVIVFASQQASPIKLQEMRSLGADVRLVPGGYGEAEKEGLKYAASHDCTWISAYNDGHVIAGQGTIGIEILEEIQGLEKASWIVPTSGGGLIAGIGAAIKQVDMPSSTVELIGVQSEASPFMYALYHDGSQAGIIELSSLADGLAGPIEKGSITIPLVRKFVDDIVLASEEEITQAIIFAWQRYGERIEGSAAASLAAVMNNHVVDRPAVVIISGGNIQPELHSEILESGKWQM